MGKRGPMPSTGDARKRLGDVSITKGSTPEGIPVVQWDSIQDCDEDRCNIFNSCPYNKYGKCGVRKEYLDYVYRHFIGSVNSENKMALFKIGMEIVPLFSHLVSMKIASHGRQVSYVDDKGNYRINPIFREIRDTIKTISSVVDGMKEAFEVSRGGIIGGGEGDDLLGDSDYYDNLFKGEAPRVERKMRNRV